MTLTKDWLKKFGWPETLITGHPLAIAHRGASDHAPENTLKAFRIAADLCAEMWEIDVRLSSDGVCVVSHDDDLGRVCGRDLLVSKSTWADISAVQLSEGQHILRLEDVIAQAETSGCGLYVDIKSDGAGLAAWRVLQASGLRFAALAAFNVNWIKELRDSGCEYPLGVMRPIGADPFAYLDGLAVEIVHPCWRDASETPHELLTSDLLNRLTESGHQIVIWHEDRSVVLDALWQKPIMGICSNRPELLKPYRQDAVHPTEVVCHRGANTLAPENTVEGAKICVDQRFQYVEIDVRTTADGELVVMHDADIARTTNGSGLVIDKTLAEIKDLDAGSWFRDGSAGYKVPTLAQMLGSVNDQAGLYIEVKHADPAKLLEVVNAHNSLEKCFFWGYDTAVMQQLRALAPNSILMAPRWMYSSIREAIAAYGAQIVEFDATKDDLSEVAKCRDLGVKSMIYSQTDDWDEIASHMDLGPDMINLDQPHRFKILSSYPGVRHHFLSMQRS